jgi:Tol biopolymer transport system component
MFRASLSGSLALLLTLNPMVNLLGGATVEKKFDLTIENIMRGVNLVGTEPGQVRWSGDSSTIYFQWKQASDPASTPNDTYAVSRDNPTPKKLSQDEARLAPPASVDTNRDRSLSVFAQDGDIAVIDNATGKRRQVTKTVEPEANPRFVPDGRHITF